MTRHWPRLVAGIAVAAAVVGLLNAGSAADAAQAVFVVCIIVLLTRMIRGGR
ncbi:MAG: hypothetical protein R6V11_01945 [Ectothiorhodospiraceae bacterium]